MKKKFLALVAVAAMAAMVALFGCSSGGQSSSAASGDSDQVKLLEDGKLIVATSPDFPPFENLENGEYVGLDMDIIKAVAEKLGLEVEFKNLEFNGIIPAIAAGGQADVGISGFTVDPDRAKEIDFTDSYYVDNLGIAAMKDGDITADNAAEKLATATIAVQAGTSGEAYVKENYPDATVQPYGNSTDAFAAMQAGQADAVCTNLAVVEKMLADAYQDADIVARIATGEEYAMVVSQDNPALTAAINDALAELAEDGTLDQLIEKHMQ